MRPENPLLGDEDILSFRYELTHSSSFPPTERLFHQNQCRKRLPISTFHNGRGINEGTGFAHSRRCAGSFCKTTQRSSAAANDQHAAELWATQFTQSSHRSLAPDPQVGFGTNTVWAPNTFTRSQSVSETGLQGGDADKCSQPSRRLEIIGSGLFPALCCRHPHKV